MVHILEESRDCSVEVSSIYNDIFVLPVSVRFHRQSFNKKTNTMTCHHVCLGGGGGGGGGGGRGGGGGGGGGIWPIVT